MTYQCEDDGGTTRTIDADNPQDAAVEFCNQTVDTEVEDLPDTITVYVTDNSGHTATIFVDITQTIAFKAQE